MNASADAARFWARLFLLEADDASLAPMRGDARFASALPATAQNLRVEFTRLFSLVVFPYASVYLDADGALNTETTARVQAAYDRAGFELPRDVPVGAPDHFGAELLFAAELFERGHADAAQKFIGEEILAWSPIFLRAVERNASEEIYRAAARATRDWLSEQTAGCKPPVAGLYSTEIVFAEVDLHAVVAEFVTPARAGMFLSKEDLFRMARTVNLPVSFGDRALMLVSLFRAAGEHERVDALLGALAAEVNAWIEEYARESRDDPTMEPFVRVWQVRAEQSLLRLQTMQRAAREADE